MKMFRKFRFLNKNAMKNETKFFQKLILCKLFHNKFYFLMSNLNIECFQLSFDIHIVHANQKCDFSKIVVPKVSKFLWPK